jgi:hypothetical protein
MGPAPLAANLREKTRTPDFQKTAKAMTEPYDLGARCVKALNPAQLFVIRAEHLAGLWVDPMGLGAPKACPLGPSLVVNDNSLTRQQSCR